ncbi:MAG: hypothetical protein H0W09_04025, partial [Solirubrobacterales bacterium]|nr:hypothetical protein [Solirubrobacterales bacterium]
MTSKKNQRERLRAERLAAERRSSGGGRGRLIMGYLIAAALGLAVVAGLVIVLSSGGSGGGRAAENLPENAFISVDSGSLLGFEPDGREGTTPPPLEQGELA